MQDPARLGLLTGGSVMVFLAALCATACLQPFSVLSFLVTCICPSLKDFPNIGRERAFYLLFCRGQRSLWPGPSEWKAKSRGRGSHWLDVDCGEAFHVCFLSYLPNSHLRCIWICPANKAWVPWDGEGMAPAHLHVLCGHPDCLLLVFMYSYTLTCDVACSFTSVLLDLQFQLDKHCWPFSHRIC